MNIIKSKKNFCKNILAYFILKWLNEILSVSPFPTPTSPAQPSPPSDK